MKAFRSDRARFIRKPFGPEPMQPEVRLLISTLGSYVHVETTLLEEGPRVLVAMIRQNPHRKSYRPGLMP